jgi:hypothetical protein
MSMRGLVMPGRSLRGLPIFLALFGIALLIYTYLKNQITLSKLNTSTANLLQQYLSAAGLNPFLTRLAVSQAAHETNGFNSAILKSNNNAFGMKYAGQLASTGEKNGYANYNNLQFSAVDFVKWYTKHRNSLLSTPLIIKDIKTYVKFLKNNNYFEAPETEYFNGVTYWYNQIYNEKEL